MAGVECTWPEQRKRGPSKGYIEALESRLNSAETLLLALLPSVDDRLLEHATEKASGHGRNDEDPRTSPVLLNKKTGADYWDEFPLNSTESVRRWQRDCEVHSHTQSQAHSSHQSQSGRSHLRSETRRSHSRATSYSRSEDYRSSMAAATAIAGMRHGTRSPKTPVPTTTMAFEPTRSPMTIGVTANPMMSVTSQNDWMQTSDPSVIGGNVDHVMSTGVPPNHSWSDQMTFSRADLNQNPNPNSNPGSNPAGSNTQNMGMYNPDFPQHLFW